MTEYEYAVRSYCSSDGSSVIREPGPLDQALADLEFLVEMENTYRRIHKGAVEPFEHKIVRRQIVEWEPHDAD